MHRLLVAGAVAFTGLMLNGCHASEASGTGTLPFVGCAADGQLGPAAAPVTADLPPAAPAWAAGRLAYYASAELGVLAPRGWHCFGLYGSDGATLVVTPQPHDAADLLRPGTRLNGPAVLLTRALGDTSGRFAVARLAARLFPSAGGFVRQVIEEGIRPAQDFQTAPYPADRLVRLTATEVAFETPGHDDGLGTDGRLAKDGQSINGLVILLPEDGMDLVKLDVRLPPEIRSLTSPIIGEVRLTKGLPRRIP